MLSYITIYVDKLVYWYLFCVTTRAPHMLGYEALTPR